MAANNCFTNKSFGFLFIFALIIRRQISTSKKPMIKTSNSIELNLWRMESKSEKKNYLKNVFLKFEERNFFYKKKIIIYCWEEKIVFKTCE